MGRSGTLANSDAFHEQYAKAEATYRAARALVLRGVGERERDSSNGAELDPRGSTR